MKMNQFLAVIAAAAGITLCMAGCGKNQADQEEPAEGIISIGFSQLGNESDWRVANTESMKATFTENGGYELLTEDAQQKQEKQIAAVRNFILREVDYIVLAPVVETGWDEVLQEAKDADIPVIIMDRMVCTEDEDLYTAWVGSDTRAEGDRAVEGLEDYLREQGREDEEISIVHLQGTEGSTAQIGRTEGLMEGLKEHPNWKLIAQENGEFTQAKAYEVMKDILERTQDIDVVYCENDNETFGVMQALDEKGISYGIGGDVILISFDATEGGLTACVQGKINLDVECNPMQGPHVESIILQLEAGETPEKKAYVDETVFTPDSLTPELIAARGY